MPLPWLRLIDGVIGATDIVRWVRGRGVAPGAAPAQALETQLAGVVVGALREAFDRDHERIEIERQRLDEERRRIERAMRLELLRQAGDREIGRLRLVAGLAATSFVGALLAAMRSAGAGISVRLLLGLGCVALLAGLAASFSAQHRVGHSLATGNDRLSPDDLSTSGGRAALWFVLAGLAAVAFGVLLG